MAASSANLAMPPIIEAVLDFDCDFPPAFSVETLEHAARAVYGADYPEARTQYLFEAAAKAERADLSLTRTRRDIDGYVFGSEDKRKFVQVRGQGFSFNRLAPYSTLDDYLPEVERTWSQFVELAKPVQVRAVRLQYVNRLPLPLVDGKLELDDYVKVGPRLPDAASLHFLAFFNEYVALEHETGNQVKTILTSEREESGKLPVLFHISVENPGPVQPDDWDALYRRVQDLREFKNRIFYDTLTEKCLTLFQ